MSDIRFKALRDRGTDLWTEIEAQRLALEARLAQKSRLNLIMSVTGAVAGVVAGVSGVALLGEWITGLAGFIAALAAALNPILRLNEETREATASALELKALQDAIRNHIYKMQIEDTFTSQNQQIFFEQRADDFRSLATGLKAKGAGFEADAAASRDRNSFPRLEYVGADQTAEADPEALQEQAEDLVAFGRGD